jgi:hypothetical protein
VGFREAIEQSGWHPARQEKAGERCGQLRESLRCAHYAPDPGQIYKNLDTDALIPDASPRPRPASRLALLNHLLEGEPATAEDLKRAASDFCHRHKMEGPEDKKAAAHTLGRVWPFRKLSDLLLSQMGELGSEKNGDRLRKTIENASLEDQEEAFEDFWLGEELQPMWSFYDPGSRHNPLANLHGGRGPRRLTGSDLASIIISGRTSNLFSGGTGFLMAGRR